MTNDRTEWLKARRSEIGGSDVAAILGLSRYMTAVDVYQDKISTEVPVDQQSEAAYFGSVLEEIVAKEFSKRTGMKVQRVNTTLRMGEGGWMIANVDRAVVNPDIAGRVYVYEESRQIETGRQISTDTILECKTASSYIADQWGPSQEDEIKAGKVVTEHKIPIYYETQVQWYLGITGASVCYVAVLLGGQDFRIYRVDRDEDVIVALRENCGKFWKENVLAHVPPAPSTKEDVTKIFPSDCGDMIEASNEVAADIGELRNIQEKIKTLQDAQDVVKDRICAALGEKSGFTIAGEKACTYKTQTSYRFEAAKFRKAQPELYNEFVKTSTTRVFRLAA